MAAAARARAPPRGRARGRARRALRARVAARAGGGAGALPGASGPYYEQQPSAGDDAVEPPRPWRVPPPRPLSALREGLCAPKDVKEAGERARTNALHFRGNYALGVLAGGAAAAALAPGGGIGFALGMLAAAAAAVVNDAFWMVWVDMVLRERCNASVGVFTDVDTLAPVVTLVVSPPRLSEEDAAARRKGVEEGLVPVGAGEMPADAVPQGDRIMSVGLSTLTAGLRAAALVLLLCGSPRAAAGAVMGAAVLAAAALVHALLKPPTLGSAFTRLMNAETREDVDYVVGLAKDKAAEEARRATASAKELGRKLFGRGKGKDENGK